MPVYEYKCTKCGAREEHILLWSDEPPVRCAACGGRLKRAYGGGRVHVSLEGWGFSKTDGLISDTRGKSFKALKERADSLVLFPDAITVNAAKRIADFALKHRLTTAADFTFFAEAGGLLSYGVDYPELIRRVAARQVDMILRGAKPAEMPIEQPTTLRLLINIKTARALGVTVPPALLIRATKLIE